VAKQAGTALARREEQCCVVLLRIVAWCCLLRGAVGASLVAQTREMRNILQYLYGKLGTLKSYGVRTCYFRIVLILSDCCLISKLGLNLLADSQGFSENSQAIVVCHGGLSPATTEMK